MPVYDCVMLLKPHVKKESLMDLVARVGRHVCARNGVLTDIKSFGTVQLGYGIKKLDGRSFQGQLMQMTMMATPNINKELHYLNKEDRLLRWLLVKHRDTQYGLDLTSGGAEDAMAMVEYNGKFVKRPNPPMYDGDSDDKVPDTDSDSDWGDLEELDEDENQEYAEDEDDNQD